MKRFGHHDSCDKVLIKSFEILKTILKAIFTGYGHEKASSDAIWHYVFASSNEEE